MHEMGDQCLKRNGIPENREDIQEQYALELFCMRFYGETLQGAPSWGSLSEALAGSSGIPRLPWWEIGANTNKRVIFLKKPRVGIIMYYVRDVLN